MPELAAMGDVGSDKSKGFISRQKDRYRAPFDRLAATHARSCVFAGTFNPDNNGYLRDPTGGRRYWPVALRQKINRVELEAERDQLWAEAVQYYRDGQRWHIEDEHLDLLVREEQAERFEQHPWHEKIAKYIEYLDEVSIPDVLDKCLGLELARQDQKCMNVVAGILKFLGRERRQMRVGELRAWRYVRTRSSPD